jgi:hypothetical protein
MTEDPVRIAEAKTMTTPRNHPSIGRSIPIQGATNGTMASQTARPRSPTRSETSRAAIAMSPRTATRSLIAPLPHSRP